MFTTCEAEISASTLTGAKHERAGLNLSFVIELWLKYKLQDGSVKHEKSEGNCEMEISAVMSFVMIPFRLSWTVLFSFNRDFPHRFQWKKQFELKKLKLLRRSLAFDVRRSGSTLLTLFDSSLSHFSFISGFSENLLTNKKVLRDFQSKVSRTEKSLAREETFENELTKLIISLSSMIWCLCPQILDFHEMSRRRKLEA